MGNQQSLRMLGDTIICLTGGFLTFSSGRPSSLSDGYYSNGIYLYCINGVNVQ